MRHVDKPLTILMGITIIIVIVMMIVRIVIIILITIIIIIITEICFLSLKYIKFKSVPINPKNSLVSINICSQLPLHEVLVAYSFS